MVKWGKVAPWCRSAMVSWCCGKVVKLCNGAVELWCSGAVVNWSRGSGEVAKWRRVEVVKMSMGEGGKGEGVKESRG